MPLRLLTNATLLHKPNACGRRSPTFDELWCKLDAGTEAYFHVVDGTRLPFRRILDNLLLVARERPIVIQSLLLTLDGDGPDDAEIGAWVDRMREIVAGGGRIDHVQVYSVARRPRPIRAAGLWLPGSRPSLRARRDAGLAAPSTPEPSPAQASSFVTRCPDTSVSRKSRPWKR